jgi:acyl-CoA hydrolase/RimJ/RimL family protein N-acetyltransferase
MTTSTSDVQSALAEENLDENSLLAALKARFHSKVRTAQQAVQSIQAGNRVFIGTACAAPRTLVAELENLAKPAPDVEMIHFLTTNVFPHDETGRATTKYRHRSFFVGSDIRAAVEQGMAEYVPIQISHVPDLIARGLLSIDVAMIQVSLPDEFGYVSLGVSVDIVASAVAAARLVIAEINPAMPRTQGETTVNIEDIGIIVPVHTPVTEYIHTPVTEQIVQRIARYIAGIIDDGATLQIGLGRIPNEAMRHLCDRHDLGIHSDVITDAILPLLDNGTLTGSKKSIAKGKIVASFAVGSRALYDTLDGNALFEFHPISWVADEAVISAQHKMVSITQGFSIDLTGQVCVDQFEGRLYGGLGAQVEFARAAARSPGGKPIVCLASTTDDETCSRIRPMLAVGEAAGLARSDVHFVVTEFGIAYLHGKSIQERALALISIAHPKFRGTLLEQAKEFGYLDKACTINNTRPYPIEDERAVKLKNGSSVTIRPALVSDAGDIRALFYQLPDTDRFTRFFRHIKSLSAEDIQRLCNPDYELTVAFVAVHGDREFGHVVGHGAYFVNPGTNLAETAFMVAPAWQGSGLGTELQRCLVDHAKRQRVSGFQAEILSNNASMIRLAQKCCSNVVTHHDEDCCHVTMMF